MRDTQTPVYLLDERRVVLFFNPAAEALTGWSAGDVVGRTCDYASEADAGDVDALTCALCPPPTAFGGRAASQVVVVPVRGGGVDRRFAIYVPLPTGDDAHVHVLAALLPEDQAPGETVHPQSAEQLHASLAEMRLQLSREFELESIIAAGPAMRRVASQVRLAGSANVGVHLSGPQGSGREFVARVIHAQGPRRLRPFVPLDCAALTPFELRRTLQRVFQPDAPGEPTPLELQPGTILLKNVTRLPRDVQQSLCEMLTPKGPPTDADAQLLSSDSESLAAAVDESLMISELFHRLTTVAIDVPPLRNRPDDLPLLAQFFLERVNRTSEEQRSGFSRETLRLLTEYNWPGNVRELKAVVEEAHPAATDPLVQPSDLPFRFRTGMDAQRLLPASQPRPIDLETHLRQVERREIERVLKECGQNRTQAARLLGLTRPRLYRRMEQLGITAGGESSQPETQPTEADSSDIDLTSSGD